MPLPRALVALVGSAVLVTASLAGGTGTLAPAAAASPGPAPLAPPGYWLVALDGGIFTFSSPYDGSTGAMVLNRPIVGMAPTVDAGGYWLVASDGGIFSFGDAKFYGSTGNLALNRPIVGMAATPTGHGYWLVASDGGIFSFGDAKFAGSTGNLVLNQPIVGMAAAPSGGYWLVASDGGMFAFGGAPFLGSMGGHPLNQPIVGMAVNPIGDPYPSGTTGYDISWPQCGPPVELPPPPYRVTIVGVNGGHPFSTNPCFASEMAWAGPSLTLYVNTGPLAVGNPVAMNGPAGACAAADLMCQSYNWGWNAANYDVDAAAAAGVTESMWWLDVEMKNMWCGTDPPNCSPAGLAQNDSDIQGMIDGLRARGASPGIYGTGYQFGLIAGNSYLPRVPLWVAGAGSEAQAPSFCAPAYWFAGGQAWLVQFPPNPFDGDYAC
jgi:hypothetical protein